MKTIVKAALKNEEEKLFVEVVVSALIEAGCKADAITIDRKTRSYGSAGVSPCRARVDNNGMSDIWVNLGVLSNTSSISMTGGLTTSKYTQFNPRFDMIDKIVAYATSESTNKFFAKNAK